MTDLLPMLTPNEVAEHLRISAKEVRRMLKGGELPGINIGRGPMKPRWRVDAASLERFKLRLLNSEPAPAAPRKRERTKDYEEIL